MGDRWKKKLKQIHHYLSDENGRAHGGHARDGHDRVHAYGRGHDRGHDRSHGRVHGCWHVPACGRARDRVNDHGHARGRVNDYPALQRGQNIYPTRTNQRSKSEASVLGNFGCGECERPP